MIFLFLSLLLLFLNFLPLKAQDRKIAIELNFFPKGNGEVRDYHGDYNLNGTFSRGYSQKNYFFTFYEQRKKFFIQFTSEVVGSCYLPLNFVKIDGYLYNSKLDRLLDGDYTFDYSDVLMRFAYKKKNCSDEKYIFLLPDNLEESNPDSYTPIFHCDSTIKQIVHYNDSINIENKALINSNSYYNYSSIEYRIKNKYMIETITTVPRDSSLPYHAAMRDNKEGYIDIISYTVIRNTKTRDCSGVITLIVCKENCYSCDEKNYCISCKSGFSYDEEKKECVNKTIFKNTYTYKNHYLDKGYNTIKPCYHTCGSCLRGPDGEKHNCEKCVSGYHSMLLDDFTRNCYEKECHFYGLFLDQNTRRCVKECKKYISYDKKECASSCDIDHNLVAGQQCTDKCDDKYPLLFEEEKRCLDSCGEHYETKDGKCVKACPKEYPYKIIDKNNKKKCTDKCEESLIYKYTSDELKKCMKECPFLAIREKLQCVRECPEDYPYKNGRFCVKECDEGTFLFEPNKVCLTECQLPFFGYKGKCVDTCPEDFPFYTIKNGRRCVESCEEEGLFYGFNKWCFDNCKSKNQVRLNKKCVINCPAEFSLSIGNYESYCYFFLSKVKDSNGVKKTFFYSLEKILSIISMYPEEFLAKTYKLQGENYYLETYSGEAQTYTRNLEHSVVDITEYSQEIAKRNFIPPNSLITVKIEEKEENSTTNRVSFQFYSSEGKNLTDELNKEEVKYNSSAPIKKIPQARINLARRMKEKNFDIFNSEDKLFDVCVNYSIDNVDLSVEDRRELYFQNMSLCQEGCRYISSDLIAKRVNCECGSEGPKPQFSSANSNFLLLKCGKNFSNTKLIGKNILFITGAVQVLLIISTAIYSLIEIPKRNSKIIGLLTSGNPPIKEESGKEPINSYEKVEKDSSREKNIQNKETRNDDEEEEEEDDDAIPSGLVFNMNSIPFEKAVKFDNRSMSETFFNSYCKKQMFLRPFFPLSKFESKAFGLCFDLFLFSLLFEINMLFFSAKFVSKIFKNEGKVKYNLVFLNSFFSLICVVLIYKFILCHLNDAFYLETVLVEAKKKETLYLILSGMMKKTKMKTFTLLFFFIGFSVFFWYHLSMFFFVYQNSQKYLNIQCWFAFFLSFVFYAFVSFALSLTRVVGIKTKCRWIYSVSFFFNKYF